MQAVETQISKRVEDVVRSVLHMPNGKELDMGAVVSRGEAFSIAMRARVPIFLKMGAQTVLLGELIEMLQK